MLRGRLSLIQRFSILCFGALVIFGFALGWVVSGALERNILQQAQEHTSSVIQAHIEAHFSEDEFLKPKSGADYAKFGIKANNIPVGTDIKKLTFWNRDGVAIWSHDRDIIGHTFAENEELTQALGGRQVAVSLTTDEEIGQKYGTVVSGSDPHVLEMYIPITYGDLCEVFGAVEVYEDAGPLYAQIAKTKTIVWMSLVGGFTFLFFVLFGIMMRASGKIEEQSDELKDLVIGLTGSLANALDAKSPWTAGHSERVGIYTEKIALKMGLPKAEIARLRLAGILHDIGKIGTYDSLLEKPGGLTPEEFELVKKHPEQGAQILREIKQLHDIIPIVEHHHERFDGGGYPKGLQGEEIPIGARILHVADSFEAITDDRPYRRARDYGAALREIMRHSGTQFDPKVVKAFVAVLSEMHAENIPAKSFGTIDFSRVSLLKNSLEDIADVS